MSLTSIYSSSQYSDYSTSDTTLESDATSNFSSVTTKTSAALIARLMTSITATLPYLADRIAEINRALASQGRVFADTTGYASVFSTRATALSPAVADSIRRDSWVNSTEDTYAVSSTNLIRNLGIDSSDNASFYRAYAAHVRNRCSRLNTELTDLTEAYDFLTIVYSILVAKAAA